MSAVSFSSIWIHVIPSKKIQTIFRDWRCWWWFWVKRVYNIKAMISKRGVAISSINIQAFFSFVISSFLSLYQFDFSLLSHQILITHRSCKPQGVKCFVRDINMILEQVLKSCCIGEEEEREPFWARIHAAIDIRRVCFDIYERLNALYHLWYLTIFFIACMYGISIFNGREWSSSHQSFFVRLKLAHCTSHQIYWHIR